jgi:hypothetical protein
VNERRKQKQHENIKCGGKNNKKMENYHQYWPLNEHHLFYLLSAFDRELRIEANPTQVHTPDKCIR